MSVLLHFPARLVRWFRAPAAVDDDESLGALYRDRLGLNRPLTERAKVVSELSQSAPVMHWTPPAARSRR